MRARTAPSVPSSRRRPLRMTWTVIASNQATPRLASRWVLGTDLAARAA